jgi:hypothetical protein
MCCSKLWVSNRCPLAFNSYGKLTIEILYSDENNIFQTPIQLRQCFCMRAVQMVLEIFCYPVFLESQNQAFSKYFLDWCVTRIIRKDLKIISLRCACECSGIFGCLLVDIVRFFIRLLLILKIFPRILFRDCSGAACNPDNCFKSCQLKI